MGGSGGRLVCSEGSRMPLFASWCRWECSRSVIRVQSSPGVVDVCPLSRGSLWKCVLTGRVSPCAVGYLCVCVISHRVDSRLSRICNRLVVKANCCVRRWVTVTGQQSDVFLLLAAFAKYFLFCFVLGEFQDAVEIGSLQSLFLFFIPNDLIWDACAR